MKTYTIATVGKFALSHPWFSRMHEGVRQFQQETGQHAFMLGPPHHDGAEQADILEDLLQQGVDALCVVPYLPQAIEPVLSKARRQGVLVITHEASNQRNTDYMIEPFDSRAFGIHLMDVLAVAMGQVGEYAICVGTLTSKSHNEWAEAAIRRQRARYPNMSLATAKIANQEEHSIAYAKVKKLLKTYPGLRGLLSFGVTAMPGVAMAIEEKERQGSLMVSGVSLVSACRPYLQNGVIRALSLWDPADIGYVMNALAFKSLKGETVIAGMDFGRPGYTEVTKQGKLLQGTAWIDVTPESMSRYDF